MKPKFFGKGQESADGLQKIVNTVNTKLSSKMFEEKQLLMGTSESGNYKWNHPELDEDEMIRRMPSNCNVISFGLFGTLLFHPFEDIKDIYYIMGEQLGYLDFKRVRLEVEEEARAEHMAKYGHSELTLDDIWTAIEERMGIPKRKGMFLEMQVEKKLCYPNALMVKVWRKLKENGKKLIVVADTHLPKAIVQTLLEDNGFHDADDIFLSCEHGKAKREGDLYDVVKASVKTDKILHIGDSEQRDVKNAKAHGLSVLPYPNVRINGGKYRPYDMSALNGSVYRAIVENHLYNGHRAYGMEYEYGYVYGGIFVVGYCNFIHEYVHSHNIDKVMFLSRKGDILKQAYDMLFPGENTEYAYWSVQAATKLNANNNKYEYFKRMLFDKANQNLNINQILTSMDLGKLVNYVQSASGKYPKYKDADGEHEYTNCERVPSVDEMLTDKNAKPLQYFLEYHWDLVLETYAEQKDAARRYYEAMLKDCKKAVAVDIGWSGSSVMALRNLIEKDWEIPCEITGIMAGTNSINDNAPDSGAMFIQSGKLVTYLYSPYFNRDLFKRHDRDKDYNMYWELLLGSPTQPFKCFAYNEITDKVRPIFGDKDVYMEGMKEIQKGILEFVKKYVEHFSDFPYMYNIGGRDAYAPMIIATSGDALYLKDISKKFRINN